MGEGEVKISPPTPSLWYRDRPVHNNGLKKGRKVIITNHVSAFAITRILLRSPSRVLGSFGA